MSGSSRALTIESSQKAKGTPTPRFHRVPVGEKGVGRFAAHKLGTKIRLITRKSGSPEVVVDIDWIHFDKKRYLEDVEIRIVERTPEHFLGGKSGTRLEIRGLRASWTRSMVRDVARSINAISSPFGGVGDFKTKLVLAGSCRMACWPSQCEGRLEVFPLSSDLPLEGKAAHIRIRVHTVQWAWTA